MRGLAHAHEDHLVHRPAGARECHLGHDLGAAHLADQAGGAGHAEHAAHRATDLGRDADPVARQQHGLDHLAVTQLHQQARRAVFARVLRFESRQRGQLVGNGRQLGHQRGRQEMFDLAPAAGLRQGLAPQAQHALLVAGVGAERAQALAQLFDAHGGYCPPRAAFGACWATSLHSRGFPHQRRMTVQRSPPR